MTKATLLTICALLFIHTVINISYHTGLTTGRSEGLAYAIARARANYDVGLGDVSCVNLDGSVYPYLTIPSQKNFDAELDKLVTE